MQNSYYQWKWQGDAEWNQPFLSFLMNIDFRRMCRGRKKMWEDGGLGWKTESSNSNRVKRKNILPQSFFSGLTENAGPASLWLLWSHHPRLLASHWLKKFDNVISIISSYNTLPQTELLVLFCLYFKQAFNSCYYRTWEVQEQGTSRFKGWPGPV